MPRSLSLSLFQPISIHLFISAWVVYKVIQLGIEGYIGLLFPFFLFLLFCFLPPPFLSFRACYQQRAKRAPSCVKAPPSDGYSPANKKRDNGGSNGRREAAAAAASAVRPRESQEILLLARPIYIYEFRKETLCAAAINHHAS